MELTRIDGIALRQKLGEGSFGLVRLGKIEADGKEVAVKLESTEVRRPLLLREAEVLSTLQSSANVPRLYASGTEGGYHYIAMQLLGSCLSHKMRVCGGKLSTLTVFYCAAQMINALEFIHSVGYVHRDIKPQNFLMGLGDARKRVYLIDFGLARKGVESSFFRSSGEMGFLTGTLPYVSINIHLGLSASRRDDIESLCYVLIYLLKGELPWHCASKPQLSETEVRRRKQHTDAIQLCEGLPAVLESMLRYVRSLRADEEINYQAIEREFRVAVSSPNDDSPLLDWEENKSPGRRKSVRSPQRNLSSTAIPSPCNSDLPSGISDISVCKQERSLSPRIHAAKIRKEKTQRKLFQGFAGRRSAILQKREAVVTKKVDIGV